MHVPVATGGGIDCARVVRGLPMTTTTSTVEATAYRCGRYSLEPGERRRLCDGKPLALGARGFDLLVALVARAGRLVTKNGLLELV